MTGLGGSGTNGNGGGLRVGASEKGRGGGRRAVINKVRSILKLIKKSSWSQKGF